MKRVLALMGSPRKGKNTDKLLDYLLNGIKENNIEVNKIYLKDKEIKDCTGCDYCGKSGNCVNKDDMNEIYSEFDKSDVIILAAPVYFNSVNSMTKTMIDRCQRYWSLKYSLNEKYKNTEDRVGIFLSTGGAPLEMNQFNGSIYVMDYFFKSINAKYKGNYFVSNTDNNPVEDRKDLKEELYEIGKNILKTKDFYLHR